MTELAELEGWDWERRLKESYDVLLLPTGLGLGKIEFREGQYRAFDIEWEEELGKTATLEEALKLFPEDAVVKRRFPDEVITATIDHLREFKYEEGEDATTNE